MSENIPESCPGTDSKTAGNSSACEGCPNQSLCSSGAIRDEKTKLINSVLEKYKNVKKIIIIMSGKGGVGKSTISMLLAHGIVHYTDFQVGYLDIDLCGPSAGRLFGVSGEIHRSNFGFSPILSDDGISVMSTDFLLNSKTDAIIWRGSKKNTLIENLILNTDWDDIDYLIVDTPPGTTDEHLSLVEYFKHCPQTTALMVYSPQELALIDVRKQFNFIKKAGIPLLGFVQNLSYIECPKCQTRSEIFPNSIKNEGTVTDIPPICSFPIDRDLSFCESEGINPFEYIKNDQHTIFTATLKMLLALDIQIKAKL